MNGMASTDAGMGRQCTLYWHSFLVDHTQPFP